jgi:hypothetical protein
MESINAVAAELTRQWARVREELQRNARMRWMVVAGGLVFVWYVLLLAGEFRQEQENAYRPLHQQLVRLEGMQAKGERLDFSGRLAKELETSAEIESRLWRAATAGLAGADFQSWLQGVAKTSGMEKIRLELSELRPRDDMLRPLWKLEADLSGFAEPAAVLDFLAAVAASNNMVVIERLRYSPGRGNRITLLLVAHFLLDSEQDGGA